MIPPDRVFQNASGTLIKSALAFSAKVNTNTDTARERTIRNAFLFLELLSKTASPNTTGKTGRMHGDNTVKTPAMKERETKSISGNCITRANCP